MTLLLAWWAAAGPAVGAVAFYAPPPRPADPREALFTCDKVYRVEVEIDPNDLESLRKDSRKYVRATIKEDGRVVTTAAGVRMRGSAGSLRSLDDKPGLTVNMDRFGDCRRFRGMDKFALTNSVQDPTYQTELLCGELFRAAGVPAARVAHAVVRINGKVRGLYLIKEGYDREFLGRDFADADGNVYDGGFLRDIDAPLDRSGGKRDVPDRADLKALWEAAHEKDLAKRFRRLDKLLDMDRFLAYVALQVVTWDWDGYPMNRNNYRLYHEPGRNKITFIPSGMDQMFGDLTGPVLPNFQGAVARGLIETPEGRAKYLAKLADVMKTVYRPDGLLRRVNELQARIRPALAGIDRRAAREYPGQVDRLRQAIPHRAENIALQLKWLEVRPRWEKAWAELTAGFLGPWLPKR